MRGIVTGTMLRRFIITGAALLMLAGCASGPQLGSAVPDFEAEEADGTRISLATFEGQVLILDFFALW